MQIFGICLLRTLDRCSALRLGRGAVGSHVSGAGGMLRWGRSLRKGCGDVEGSNKTCQNEYRSHGASCINPKVGGRCNVEHNVMVWNPPGREGMKLRWTGRWRWAQ